MNRMVSIEKIKEFLLIILMLFITVYLFFVSTQLHTEKTINEANNEASKSKKSTVANPTKG